MSNTIEAIRARNINKSWYTGGDISPSLDHCTEDELMSLMKSDTITGYRYNHHTADNVINDFSNKELSLWLASKGIKPTSNVFNIPLEKGDIKQIQFIADLFPELVDSLVPRDEYHDVLIQSNTYKPALEWLIKNYPHILDMKAMLNRALEYNDPTVGYLNDQIVQLLKGI